MAREGARHRRALGRRHETADEAQDASRSDIQQAALVNVSATAAMIEKTAPRPDGGWSNSVLSRGA